MLKQVKQRRTDMRISSKSQFSNRMVKSILLLTLPLFSMQLHAQETNSFNELNQSESRLVLLRVQEYVGQFSQYLQDISDKSITLKSRYKYKDIALSLFMGGGDEYYEEILDDNNNVIDTVRHDPVKISMIRRNRMIKKPLKVYLRSLAELRDKPVAISSIECHEMRVSSFQKVAEGKYVCTIYYEQVFINNNREEKMNATKCGIRKRLSCSVELIKTEDGIEEFLVLLGDVVGDSRIDI